MQKSRSVTSRHYCKRKHPRSRKLYERCMRRTKKKLRLAIRSKRVRRRGG